MRISNIDSKRVLDLVVISDVHLGTFGSHAEELKRYLRSIQPKTLILNGDIIDMWQFRKKYWPASHTAVLREILRMSADGTEVYYITGNHDEILRKFNGYCLGEIKIVNKVVLELEDKKAWFFHGDVFDVTMKYSRWLTKLGSIGYDFLIWLNYRVNKMLELFGREKISLSKRIKNSVKGAVKYINQFEEICADLAIENDFQYVVCGHIHQPEIRVIKNAEGEVTYLNSGDWVENLTSLEYNNGKWEIFNFFDHLYLMDNGIENYANSKDLFEALIKEFELFKPVAS